MPDHQPIRDTGRATTRRGVLLSGLSAMLAGCVAGGMNSRNSTGVGGVGDFYIAGPDQEHRRASSSTWQPAPRPLEPRTIRTPQEQVEHTAHILSRARWTSLKPIPNRVQSMSGVRRITVHHEGWTPVYFTDMDETIARLAQIRKVHVKDRGWGDIGYHFVIDRGGRVWEARPIMYQGAHAGPNGANLHNVGVMLLGNFDKQRPSEEQFAALVYMLRYLRGHYRVNTREIFTHQELNPTRCPGKVLQAQMVALRQRADLL